ncbi:MAG: DUF6261 family protein [Paludibacter sp.]|nr:DUF6261 family protein [Paludibacter sp.]
MSKFELTSLTAANLTINNAFSLFKTSIEVSIPFKSNFGPIESAALAQFILDNDNFGKQINKSQKSDLTKKLDALDKDRVGFWKEIKRIENSYVKSPDLTKKEAALTIQSFIAPYVDADSLPLNSKSGVFSEISTKYNANAAVQAAAKVLGLDSSFASFETKNKASNVIYKSRNDEYAKAEASGTSLKPAAVASYNMFCTAIEQAANFTPSDKIISLFHQLDELRKTYHALGGSGKDTPAAPDAPAK